VLIYHSVWREITIFLNYIYTVFDKRAHISSSEWCYYFSQNCKHVHFWMLCFGVETDFFSFLLSPRDAVQTYNWKQELYPVFSLQLNNLTSIFTYIWWVTLSNITSIHNVTPKYFNLPLTREVIHKSGPVATIAVTLHHLTFMSHWSITEETTSKVNIKPIYLTTNLLFVSYYRTYLDNVVIRI